MGSSSTSTWRGGSRSLCCGTRCVSVRSGWLPSTGPACGGCWAGAGTCRSRRSGRGCCARWAAAWRATLAARRASWWRRRRDRRRRWRSCWRRTFQGSGTRACTRGRQVFFYKRAQIFAADLWGAFGGQGLGAFRDARALTMFADYRVPVVLRLMGCLRYSDALAAAVDGKQELPPGSEEEVEIRAASITAVELLRDAANEVLRRAREHNGWPAGRGGGVGQPPPQQLISVQLDWWLWAEGERMRARHPPHHRTLTVFY